MIFNGWGGLVGLIVCGLIGAGLQAITGSPTVGFVSAGLALTGFGFWLNLGRPWRESDALFWVPIQFWGPLIIVIGLLGS